MKIVFLSRLFWPNLGGVETHVLNLSHQLIKQGHVVTVITSQHDPKLPITEEFQNIHIIRIPHHFLKSKLKLWIWMYSHKHLYKSADIIHAHDVTWWYFPSKLILPSKPIYTTFHGWEGTYPLSRKSIVWRRLSELISLKNICVGDFISRWYATQPDLVTYGATNCLPHPQSQKPHIVVLGRLSKDNDLPIILDALSQITKHRSIKITFVGDGVLASQAQKIGNVTGFVNDTDNYIKKASMVITSSYLSMLDTMAIGRPIMSVYSNLLKSDYLSLHPMHQHFSINPSIPQLTTNINGLLNNPDAQNANIKTAQQWAIKQTWDKLTNQYIELWQRN